MNAHSPIQAEVAADPLAKLREPFPDHQISKLPKETKQQADQRKADMKTGIKCHVCGGWHHRNAVHLDYVGHAALTDRLLDTDPLWSWEPVAFAQNGLPAFDNNGGLWIKLTVCGVTRLGYGNADGKSGGDAIKEIIGDALRNAAMRFGAALDLWHKGDLHGPDEPGEALPSAEETAINMLRAVAVDKVTFTDAWAKNKAGWKELLEPEAYARVVAAMKECAADIAAREAEEKAKANAEGGFGIPDDEIPF